MRAYGQMFIDIRQFQRFNKTRLLKTTRKQERRVLSFGINREISRDGKFIAAGQGMH